MFFKAHARITSISTALFLILIIPQSMRAQESGAYEATRPANATILNLEQALDLALEQSWRIERGRMGLARAEFNLTAVRAALKSNASLSLTLPDYDRSLRDWTNSSGITTVIKNQSAKYFGKISIRQPLSTDGVISLNGTLNRNQTELYSYSSDDKYYGSANIRFDQPILQPNGIKNAIRKAEISLEETYLGFQDEEIRIRTDISRKFFEILEMTYQDKLAREEVDRLEQVYVTGQQLFADGTITELNLLQLEVELSSRRDNASATAGRLDRELDDFKQDLGLPLDDEIALEPVLEQVEVVIDENAMMEQALAQRSDLRRTLNRRENHEMDLAERRSRGRLTGNISISLGLDAQGQEFYDMADSWLDPDQARGVAITFSLPLWDWGRNDATVASKQIDIDQNYRTEEENIKTIAREVSSAVARVREADTRLTQLLPGLDAAERSYELTLQQFQSGAINAQDIMLTKNRLFESHNTYLEAYLDYRRAIIDMTAVTSGSGYSRGGRGF